MLSRAADNELERFLVAHAPQGRQLTPRRAVEAMLAFYCDVRAEDCVLENDGDMLLFQWGTYDWGKGPHFELDMTRQFIRKRIWQLSLTFVFQPTDELRTLDQGNRWCHTPSELDDFGAFVNASRAFAAVADRADGDLRRAFGST